MAILVSFSNPPGVFQERVKNATNAKRRLNDIRRVLEHVDLLRLTRNFNHCRSDFVRLTVFGCHGHLATRVKSRRFSETHPPLAVKSALSLSSWSSDKANKAFSTTLAFFLKAGPNSFLLIFKTVFSTTFGSASRSRATRRSFVFSVCLVKSNADRSAQPTHSTHPLEHLSER